MSAEIEAVGTGRILYIGMWVQDYFGEVIASGLGLSRRINILGIRSIWEVVAC